MINIYRASAGSGKTYRLAQDYIHLLFDPKKSRAHRRILAVTFTNKATAEMKSRILEELHTLAQGGESDYRAGIMQKFHLDEDAVNAKAAKILISILHDYSSFSISTIDKFFQQVIRSFARDIGVQGGYNLELDSDDTLQQSVDNLFLELSDASNKQLLQWLTKYAEERIENSESWNLRNNILELGKEVFKESYQHKAEETNKKLHDRSFLAEFRKELRGIIENFEKKLKDKALSAQKILDDNGFNTEDFKGGKNSQMKTFRKIIDGKYEITATFRTFAEAIENCFVKKPSADLVNAFSAVYNNGLQELMLQIVQIVDSETVAYNSAQIVLKHLNTLGILTDLAQQIKKLTEEQNSMLISDSNMLLNKIIDNSDMPFVYEKTGVHIDNFMIDEFQDTSVLQWKNFRPLIGNSLADGKFNLVVGDVKQSIYRWRNSDWKLLDEQLQHDFRPEQLNEENLDTNWRSDKNIVAFNNTFFKHAAVVLQSRLNESLNPVLPVYPALQSLTDKILHAYAQLYQKTSKKAGEGLVNFQFIATEDEDDKWTAQSLDRLPSIIESLQDRGYKPGDIAFLVRTKNEEQKVVQKLLSYKKSSLAREGYSYDILSNEGLLIGAAASVRFVLGILYLFVNPDDSIQQTIVAYEYARGKMGLPENEALNCCFNHKSSAQVRFPLFTSHENEVLESLLHVSLFDKVEQIIALFGVGNWHNEAVFIQAFQDLVFSYVTGRTAETYSFLKWWEKTGVKKTISAPDNQDAFQIMTIHKSKGLDFKVVIMPFCDWKFEKSSTGSIRNILWVQPHQAPFDKLPLIPVEYTQKLGNSIFAGSYFDEQMHQFIDNLNVAYVAFTRAKHELICLAPAPKKMPDDVLRISSLAEMLLFVFGNNIQQPDELQLNDFYQEDDNNFIMGSPSTYFSKDKEVKENNVRLESYASVNAFARLRVRHQHLDFWLENQEMETSKLNYGIVMHDVLRKIRNRSDQENILAEMVRGGIIAQADVAKIESELNDFWKIPETAEWFAPDVISLTERDILTPSGALYRPDRVIIKGNEATVVDYKFGEKEEKKHVQQVQQYMQLVGEMGYDTKGVICYVALKKLVHL